MIDVFVRVYGKDPLRRAMSEVVLTRWRMQKDANLAVFDSEWSNMEGKFHIESKRKAEVFAQSDIYVVADDDQLILGQDWIQKGCSILNAHPEYGMLSGWSIIEHTRDYGKSDLDILPLHSIGCPYFVRKGTLNHFPECNKQYYDGELSKVVTDQGLKTGVMPQVQYNHFGYRYSVIGDSDGCQ
jgi:hypothetical protein